MSDGKHGLRPCAVAFAVAFALGLSGCGGGGGGGGANVRPTPPPPIGGSDFTGGTVNVDAGNTTVWPADIGGSIDLVKGGAGTLVLTGTDSYTGGTTISAGALQLGNGGTTGWIVGDVTDNGSLVFDRSDNVSFAGVVSGSGSLTQAGTGTLILTGNNTYTGGTTISVGTLQLGNGGTTGWIVGDVTDNGSLVFDRSDNVNFAGVVNGSGSLTQAGTGTLTLTGNDTYTGGTTINAGTLQLGNGGTTGWVVGNVTDNGSLVFDRSDNVSFSGTVSGSGSLTQAGTGRLTLTGNNTYTGGTTISAGTLQLGNGGTTGWVVGNVTDNGSLVFDRSDNVSFAGVVSGSGSLTQAGTGTLTLTGNNTYTGGTTISAGTLQLGNGGTTGWVVGDVTDNGSLVFDRSDNMSFAGVVSGSGSLTQAGTGTLTLTGGNTYAGITKISAGTLALTGNGSVASSSGVNDTGTFDILGTSNGTTIASLSGDGTVMLGSKTLTLSNAADTFGGVISGTGGLTLTGGTEILTGANTYTGGTAISDGTLQLGGGGTTGWVVGDVTNNGILVFDRSDNLIFTDIVSGGGSLVQAGTGTLTLTGSNTYSGGTTISAGILQLGSGGTAGSITGGVTDNGSLVFDRSDNVSFSGVISGGGSLTQVGTGTLTLDGNSSSFIGSSTVAAGTLVVGSAANNGAALGGNVTVDASATLRGHGTIGGNVDVLFGGIVTPGDSIGTLTVNGNFTAAQGSLMDFAFGAPGANFHQAAGTGDNVIVGGNLILNGATLNVTNTGGMGPGLYNIFSYGGTLTETNGGLRLGSTAGQTLFLQHLTASKQINLVNTTGYTVHFWNANGQASGTQIGGGSGTWSATSQVWTDITGAVPNGPMSPQPSFAVFAGAPGTVTVDDGAGNVSATGLQFAVDGYTLTGSTLTLVSTITNGFASQPFINVGNGTSAGAGMTATIANVLVGTNGFNKTDFGTLVLTGANTYGGITQVNGGALEIAPGGVPGSGQVVVDDSSNQASTLRVDNGASLPNLVVLSNGGMLDNAGTLNDPASGYTVVSDIGTATVSNTGTITGIQTAVGLSYGGSINNTGTITGNIDGASLTGGGSISNIGGTITGTSRTGVTLTGGGLISNVGGTISGGITGVSIAVAAGSLVNNNGGIIRGPADGVLVVNGGTITNGAGSLIETTGTTSGDCNASGDCAIFVPASWPTSGSNGGPLSLSNAGSIVGNVQLFMGAANTVELTAGGSIQGDLSIGTSTQSTLTLDGDNATPQLYSHAVTGTTTFAGNLVKSGSGTWVIDNSALQNVVDTSVNAGTLRATQMLSGEVTVGASGNLDAVPGVVGDLSNVGRVAVHGGDSTVGGNYTQASTGTLAVSLGSKLAVTGTATLNGGTLEVTGADSGYVANTHTDVLTATGSLTGTFAQLVKDTGVVFTATTIQYDANSAWLDTTGLNVTTAAAGAGVSYTPASMQSALRVQAAFEQIDSKIATNNLSGVPGDFLHAAGQFQQAPTLQAAQASLQSLSGELHAASAAMTFEAIDASSCALSDRFDSLLGKRSSFGVWTQSLDVGGDMARTGYDGVGFQLNGWLVGSDREIGHSGVAGFAFGQSQGRQQADQGFGRDNNRSTESMVYAGWLNGNWYTQGRVGFGHFQQDVNRQILLGYSAQGVSTQYSGNYGVAYGESGLYLNYGGTHITPFVDVEYASIDRGGFAEQGAGGFGLRSGTQALDRWQSGLGVRADRRWDLGDGRAVNLGAHAQWQRTLASHGDVFDASFVGLQQWQPLTGIGLSRYSALFGFKLDATLSARTMLNFGYDYEMGQRVSAQMLSARLNVAF
ncbi:autotransporter-associated beta strand repeat-containing protein [Dyella agri]|uniref:Autotransporter-associated beta strand repeat-containing protein n=1 Tax=Dyella agri TaxID=1926869 RepID=A0ABW8KG78_9GAMM